MPSKSFSEESQRRPAIPRLGDCPSSGFLGQLAA
jgi:hypothetical protein